MVDEEKSENQKPESRSEDSLGMTRRGLYAREESAEYKERSERLRRLGIERRQDAPVHEADTLAKTVFKNLTALRAKKFARLAWVGGLTFFGIVLIVLAVSVTLWYRSQFEVGTEQIGIVTEAPLEVTAGDDVRYTVTYENNSRVDWLNVEIIFSPPPGFTFRESSLTVDQQGRDLVARLEKLESGAKGSFEIRGQLIGELNEAAVAETTMFITPENFPSGRFDKSHVMATTIAAVPIEVALNIPGSVGKGERVVGRLTVRNLSRSALEGVYLRMSPPLEMELESGDAEFTAGFSETENRWELGQLDSLESRELTFIFYVTGEAGEKRVIDFEAGIRQPDGDTFVQRRLSHTLTLSARELDVRQTVNGSSEPIVVKPGETVEGRVYYRNVGTIGLREAIVQLSFEGVGFDPDSLEIETGSYNSSTQTVSWSAATEPQLGVIQPQEEGVLEYSFTVLETNRFPLEDDGSSNNVIVTRAFVDSPDIPSPEGQPRKIASDRAVMSVGTNLRLQTDAYYDDGRIGIESDGPLPPQVGEETTYTIRFRIGTTLNAVADVRLNATLPDGVRYTGEHFVTGGELSHNPRTGQLLWTVVQMPSSTGRNLPPEELHIQVAIVPGENQRDQEVDLLNQLSLSAVDQFTEQAEEVVVEQLPDTESAAPGRGQVE